MLACVRRSACGLLTAAALGPAFSATPTADDYARRPAVQVVGVSPSNGHAAMLVRTPRGRIALATVGLDEGAQPRVIAAYDDVDVVRVAWVNDQRLVYQVQQPGPVVEYEMWGTFAIDRDGEAHRHLITARSDTEAATGSAIRQRVLTRDWTYWKPVGDGSDDVYVKRWADTLDRGHQPLAIARVDTRSARPTIVSHGQPDNADGWLFDATGRLAVVTTTSKNQQKLWWQPSAGEPWKVVHEWTLDGQGGVRPLALEGNGTLIVSAAVRRDTDALHVFDLKKGEIDQEPLVGVDHYDVESARFDPRVQQVVGAPVYAHQPMTVWFDEGLASAQAAVDKALAGRSNTLLCSHCVGATRFVVHSTSDRQPGEYYVYDARSSRLRLLAASRPWIDEATQGRRSHHLVAARDGLTLPVVVTHPVAMPSDRPAPTVVLVHGGPWVNGAMLTWDAEPQFLAGLGYRVLEVSYRGTTGLGWKHFRASWGQYGLAMQDDLEDAVLWAVREKLADPERVCIYGGSYGGYAALMGPVQHPGRYRCAVSHVGVTDLSLLFSGNWTDIASNWRKHSLPQLIGDPVKDAARLRDLSPVHRVGDIKVPVLVAQGRRDPRVSPEHADRFVSAARRAGVSVERIDYDEGHGFSRPEAEADFWNRLAAFFDKHIGRR